MTIRFQADVNLNQIILGAECRRELALEFQTVETAGLAGLPDPEVLAHAAEDGRILVTHDLQTMPRHFGAFITTRQSTGLLLIPSICRSRLPSTICCSFGPPWRRKSGRIPCGISPCKATPTRHERMRCTNGETFGYSCVIVGEIATLRILTVWGLAAASPPAARGRGAPPATAQGS